MGIALVMDVFGGRLKLNRLGLIAAMLASFSFASYNVFGGQLEQQHDRWKALTYVLLGAVTFWLFLNPPWRIVAANYSGRQWTFLAVFAITSVLLPFSFYFSGLHHLDRRARLSPVALNRSSQLRSPRPRWASS
jgi:drug/metabolite transporter (DMT)-like permease